ncbi:FAD/NAD(P)-binding domain-containing protein [Xylariomycetidae sp. FL0641]|nr:FAD/NAD(P)-binding domain-containing protein [Xylariomycetidae sp. FL0641]
MGRKSREDDNGSSDDALHVLIAGGGITGLSLAVMLERHGIGFTVLEGRPEIAPQLGAAIVCWPHMLRIVHQLGLYDEYVAPAVRLEDMIDAWPDGTINAHLKGVGALFERLTGYPVVVQERQQALQTLYNALRGKKHVVTGARVSSVEETASGVVVARTQDGRSFPGHLLVGADGVHSAARRHVRRCQGVPAAADADDIRCRFAALFGKARFDRLVRGGSNTVNHGTSIQVMSTGTRCYYFLNVALPRELRGREIAPFSEQDERALARKHWDKPLAGATCTFGDMYARTERSALVPLQQYTLKGWHSGRVLLLGDAVHKPHPGTAQGAAMCFEDSATLLNVLHAHLGRAPRASAATAARLGAVFAEVERRRYARVKAVVDLSFRAEAAYTWQNAALRFALMHVAPRLGHDLLVLLFLSTVRAGPRLTGLPPPAPEARGALVGFDDARPAAPRWPRRLAGAALLAAAALAYRRHADDEATQQERSPLAALHLAGLYLATLVEGWRRANMLALPLWPALRAPLADGLGANRAVPLLCLASLLLAGDRYHYTAAGRPLLLAAAKTIFPVFGVLYLLPVLGRLAGGGPAALAGGLGGPLGAGVPSFTVAVVANAVLTRFCRDADHILGDRYLKYVRAGYVAFIPVLALFHLLNFRQFSDPEFLTSLLPALSSQLVWLMSNVADVCFYSGIGHLTLLYVLFVPVAFAVLGPSAATLAVWYWREVRLAGNGSGTTVKG